MPPQSPPETPPTSQPSYDFIMNPAKPPRPGLFSNLPGTNSLAMRALYIVGGLLILLIIFIFIKGLFGRGNTTPLVAVVQDQQAIIHIDAGIDPQQTISVGNRNFALTSQLSLLSARGTLIQYLADNGRKLNQKTLNLKVSAATDQDLQNAATAATYDQTFKQVMNTRLTTYLNDLKLAYSQTKTLRGRTLLKDDFKQAQLLQAQLNVPGQ